MMNKGISKILKSLLSILLLVCPFSIKPHVVKAESVGGGSPIIGVNITQIDREYGQRPYQGTVTLTTDMTRWQCVSGTSSKCNVWQSQDTSDVVQDDITGKITYSGSSWDVALYEYDFVFDDEYVGSVLFNNTTVGATTVQRYYVNGSHLKLTSTQLITSFTISDYSLIRKNSDNIMWVYPVESFSTIFFLENNSGYQNVGINSLNNYKFPIYLSDSTKLLSTSRLNPNTPFYVIMWVNANVFNESTFNDTFEYNGTLLSCIPIYAATRSYIIRAEIVGDSSLLINLKFKTDGIKFMPIYFNRGYEYISTDFALNFGLSNRVIDKLDVIANGTVSSNESAADNDSATDDLVSASDSLIQQETSFNDSMNSSLQNIDTSSDLNAMGSKFSSSANWVTVQFNRLTNSTPFGSVLSFTLLLGLALLLIGRWRHD